MKTLLTTLGMKEFHSKHIRTVHFGSDTLSYLAPKTWELVPEEIKKLESVSSVKIAIKKWKSANVAYAQHIHFRLTLCNYFIIQSKTFFPFSFINIYSTINICTPANIGG